MGKIAIDKERCKGCQLCLVTCPKKIIRMADEFNAKGYHFIVCDEAAGCSACTLCGKICPDMAIEVYR